MRTMSAMGSSLDVGRPGTGGRMGPLARFAGGGEQVRGAPGAGPGRGRTFLGPPYLSQTGGPVKRDPDAAGEGLTRPPAAAGRGLDSPGGYLVGGGGAKEGNVSFWAFLGP